MLNSAQITVGHISFKVRSQVLDQQPAIFGLAIRNRTHQICFAHLKFIGRLFGKIKTKTNQMTIISVGKTKYRT